MKTYDVLGNVSAIFLHTALLSLRYIEDGCIPRYQSRWTIASLATKILQPFWIEEFSGEVGAMLPLAHSLNGTNYSSSVLTWLICLYQGQV